MSEVAAGASAQTPSKKLKILHALAFADAGHEVQIFLTGEATYLMRKATVDAVKPIGWPVLSEMMQNIVAKGVPVFS